MTEQHRHDLSDRQMAILTFIYDYQVTHGFVPTIRELASATHSSSTSVVSHHISRLVELEYISKVNDVSRGMRLLKPAYAVVGTGASEVTNQSVMWAELRALRSENQRIHELYQTRVRQLEQERNQLAQRLSMLKHRAMKQIEDVFEVECMS